MTKFQNAAVAGCQLADCLDKYRRSTDAVVIAITNGGVFVAEEIARELKLPLELLFIRRLIAPFGPQRAVCATNVAGTMVVDEELEQVTRSAGMDHAIADGIKQLSERERFCRAGRPPVDISTKQVIIVDNGIHTGSTMQTAIRAVRKLDVRKVIAAVPVSDLNSRDVIESAADEFVCLAWPEKFGHVGLWYKEFLRPTNDQILNLYLDTFEEND
ncbi:MAG TPA: phosphoribosyltransferase family protein [Pyrinomonadaceae bacterium]